VVLLFFIQQASSNLKNTWWYDRPDQDSTLLFDALQWNDGEELFYMDHPALGNTPLYGWGLRFLEFAGKAPLSKYSQLESLSDPIIALPELYSAARLLSLLMVLLVFFFIGTVNRQNIWDTQGSFVD